MQRIFGILGSLDDGGYAGRASIFQDGLDLFLGWEVLRNVELERIPSITLDRVVACLIYGGSAVGIARGLLEEIGNTNRGGRARLVEEGDDV